MEEGYRFFKMEGIGNDYIYFDLTDEEFETVQIQERNIPVLCDRRFGVGGDGVVIMKKSEKADLKMLMWNSDGSSSKVCGNALRCVSFYWYKKTKKRELLVESGAMVHDAVVLEDNGYKGTVKVNMGKPVFDAEKIPYAITVNNYPDYPRFYEDTYLKKEGIVVSMGNPHCVFFVENVDTLDVSRIGSYVEHHELFPERTNVEFVEILEDGTLYQRTWERGSGETLACGSGACAVHVAGVLEKNLPRKNKIKLRGGTLEIAWEDDGNVYMTGEASFVFSGKLMKEIPVFTLKK